MGPLLDTNLRGLSHFNSEQYYCCRYATDFLDLLGGYKQMCPLRYQRALCARHSAIAGLIDRVEVNVVVSNSIEFRFRLPHRLLSAAATVLWPPLCSKLNLDEPLSSPRIVVLTRRVGTRHAVPVDKSECASDVIGIVIGTTDRDAVEDIEVLHPKL
jgi:hypothetical protein